MGQRGLAAGRRWTLAVVAAASFANWDATAHASGPGECGANLTDPADLAYCGARGEPRGGEAYEFTGDPDATFTNFAVPVDSVDGHRMYFGSLITEESGENVYHAYFLAVLKGDAIKVVDLVDHPPEASDFRIEGSTVRIIDAAGNTLATYQVVARSLVPSAPTVD